ncbi:MAG TPA: hypothetical protein VMW69_14890 [Spirochaetia bacterium]|nr:hypothetical protein [Spirochaetia bacterium]
MLAGYDGASLNEQELDILLADCGHAAIFQIAYPQLPAKASIGSSGQLVLVNKLIVGMFIKSVNIMEIIVASRKETNAMNAPFPLGDRANPRVECDIINP